MRNSNCRYQMVFVGLIVLGFAAAAQAAERPPTSDHPPTFTSPATSEANAGVEAGSRSRSDQVGLGEALLATRIDDLLGKEVVNTDGQLIGEIERVVRDREGRTLQMLISTGGFLGLGEKHLALPLENARLEGDQIHLTEPLHEQQMQAAIETYEKRDYQEISRQGSNETVADASGVRSG